MDSLIKTFKYRLKDKRAKRLLLAQSYAVNQVWNWAVAQQRDVEARYRAGAPKRKWATSFDLGRQLAGVGAELGILQHTVYAVCDQFERSRNQHKRCPKFRASFGIKRALGWVPFKQGSSRRIDGNSVTYRGNTFKFFGTKRRPVPDTAKGGAFIEDALGRWWVVFHVEVEQAGRAADGAVGIDLGLKSLATLSNGEVIENPRHVRQYAERLAVAQRAGNKRRAKAIYAKIGNVRRDFHHKLSTRLAREHAFIAVGNVNAKRLAKTRMAKSVLDAGWSTFRTMLAYKAATYVLVDERFTSRTCSGCGCIPSSSPKGIGALGIRSWICSDCGASHDRDVNAALNILRIGRSVAVPGEESRRIAA